MAVPNFLNSNKGRTFPFLQHAQELIELSESSSISIDTVFSMSLLPNSAVVDFGSVMGSQSFYEEGTHHVYLFEIRREATTFAFDFRSTAPGLAGLSLVFRRAIASDDFETEYVSESTENEVSVSGSLSVSECVQDSIWSGYMVSGSMEELAEILVSQGDVLRGGEDDVIVEPALNRSLVDQYIRSINLANDDRSRAENASGCQQLNWPFDIAPLYLNHSCMTGQIRWKEGYNVTIDQDDIENSITINAVVGGGEGEPCEEVPLFTEETAAQGQTLLSGGPDCNDVIRSINGVGGRVLDLLGGRGVIVTPEPNRNRLIIDIDMTDLKVCADFVNPEEIESSISASFCGPA